MYIVNMHAQNFHEPKEIQFWKKYQINQEVTQKCSKKKNCPHYIPILESTHHWRNQNEKISKENKVKAKNIEHMKYIK